MDEIYSITTYRVKSNCRHNRNRLQPLIILRAMANFAGGEMRFGDGIGFVLLVLGLNFRRFDRPHISLHR